MSLLVVSIILFYGVGTGVFSEALLINLQKNYSNPNISWKNKNVIVLLGAGAERLDWNQALKPSIIAYSRIFSAFQYYRDCKINRKNCTLLISGGDAVNIGKSEAEIYHQDLIRAGVSPKDFILEAKSKNTYQNALYSSELIKQSRFDQVILITSGIHLKRSLILFKKHNINPIPVPADFMMPYLTLIPNSYNFAMMDFALHEYIGMLQFKIYNALGWNKNSNISST